MPSPVDKPAPPPRQDLLQFLASRVWPHLPPGVKGRPVTREEKEGYLGYGRAGV